MEKYIIKHSRGYYEIHELGKGFVCSADTYKEAIEEIEELKKSEGENEKLVS